MIIKVIPLPEDAVKTFRGKGKEKYSVAQLIEDRRIERKKEDVESDRHEKDSRKK